VRLVLAFALLVTTPVVAQAQIYAWRDAGGNLVLSDTPKDPSAKTYAVSATGSFRTTKAALSSRASAYDDLITQHASRNDVSPDLVRAVIQAESAFNPRAQSVKGALGLMQLMPATAAEFNVLNVFDPAENIRAGVAYLKSLLTRYNNDESLALAAYNAGPTAVEKYGRTVPPYRETRNYVARIRASANVRPARRVFRTVDIVDGREVVRYSNKPSAGAEIVKSAERR
jgi:soluble lytic murein transglycosylase-like protein